MLIIILVVLLVLSPRKRLRRGRIAETGGYYPSGGLGLVVVNSANPSAAWKNIATRFTAWDSRCWADPLPVS